jgi:hypothetical protein
VVKDTVPAGTGASRKLYIVVFKAETAGVVI